jgi:hypothetical protein
MIATERACGFHAMRVVVSIATTGNTETMHRNEVQLVIYGVRCDAAKSRKGDRTFVCGNKD